MKSYLVSGTLRCVGCSTFEDYRNSVETDGALARQFSVVRIFLCIRLKIIDLSKQDIRL